MAVTKQSLCKRDEDCRILKTFEKCDNCTETIPQQELKKIFPIVAGNIVGLSA
jgi:hypothetical protein